MRFAMQCAAGCLCVGVPFFIGYDSYDIWKSVIAGSIGGGVYVSVLLIISLKHFSSSREKFLAVSGCLILMAGFASYTVIQYRMATYQHETLRKIRTVIGEGIIKSDKIYGSMMPVFRAYYGQPEGRKKTMVETFKGIHGAAISNGVFNKHQNNEMDIQTFVTFSGDSVVSYICVDSIAGGWNAEFKNSTGHSGKLQYRATLTQNGVSYERTN
jgi:hypothetical protein